MIILHEIKKIIMMPALWGFVALLTVLNCVLALNGNFSGEIDYINAVNGIAGDKYNSAYLSSVKAMLPPDEAERTLESFYHEDILAAAEGFDGGRTAKYFSKEYAAYAESEEIKSMPFSELITSLLGKKYDKIKTVAAQKNASGEVNAVAFGGETGRVFGYASGTLGVLMLAESALIAALVILFSMSYESINNTDILLYSTKAGRLKFALYKTAAALAVSTLIFAFIYAVTYGCFFAQNDFSRVWDAPISAYYNSVRVGQVSMPVVAWSSMTFSGYFILSTLLGYFVMLVFFAFSCALGLIMKNTYAAFGIVAFVSLVNAALMVFPPPSPLAMLLAYMFPAGIIGLMPAWFQYAGTVTLLPYQETVMTAFWLLITAAAFFFSLRVFIKKDIK